MTELLEDLRKQEGPAFLIVTADMRIAQALADDIMIFKDGKLVERGLLGDIMRAPKTDETRKLLAAAAPRTRDPEPVAEPPKAEPSDESQPLQAEPPEQAPASAAEAAHEPEPSSQEELDSPILLDEPIVDETELGEQFQVGVTETPE
jgi:ABC-type glutathione transport system ATPase component